MRRLVVLLALVAVAVPATAALAGTYRPGNSKWCGSVSGTQNNLTFDVYAKNVRCTKARSVFFRTVDGRRDAPGWRCAQYGFAGGSVVGTRCTASGHRRAYGIPR